MTSTASRTQDPATSHEAERRFAESGARATHCALVLAAVRAQPGSTGTELGEASGLGQGPAMRRLNDLRHDGLGWQGAVRGPGKRRQISWWPVLTQPPMQGRFWAEEA